MKHTLYICLFLLMTAIAGLSISGCVSQTPVPQYAEDLTFSVIYTHDDVTNLSSKAIKDDTASALNSVITARNLKISSIDFEAVKSDLTAVRDTERRIQLLRQYARGSQFILLTEISTEFYSPLSGRYRWDVNVHLSAYDLITRNTVEDKFTVPAVLMYAHENGDDAIASVQNDIQRRIGGLVDSFLKGRVVRSDEEVKSVEKKALPSIPPAEPAPIAEQPQENIPAESNSNPESIFSSESAQNPAESAPAESDEASAPVSE